MGQAKRRGTFEQRKAQSIALKACAEEIQQRQELTKPARRRANRPQSKLLLAATVAATMFSGK